MIREGESAPVRGAGSALMGAFASAVAGLVRFLLAGGLVGADGSALLFAARVALRVCLRCAVMTMKGCRTVERESAGTTCVGRMASSNELGCGHC